VHLARPFPVSYTIGNLAVAADGNDEAANVGLHENSAGGADNDHDEPSLWEHTLRLDRFDGARLLQAQYGSATFYYTNVGTCALINATPPGTPSVYYFAGYGIW
jgi:hypothetical protein